MALWLDALAAAERENQPAVLVTLLEVRGSTPRDPGANAGSSRPAVTRAGQHGRIGFAGRTCSQ